MHGAGELNFVDVAAVARDALQRHGTLEVLLETEDDSGASPPAPVRFSLSRP